MGKKDTKNSGAEILSLSLLENGLDFILKGLIELFGEDHSRKGAKPVDIDARNYKYGITSLFAGFLLLLKERLSQHIPELIFTGNLAEIRQKLQAGKRMPTTVGLDEALERLEIGPKVAFTEKDLDVIRRIQDFRNQFEHYKVSLNKYQLWAEVIKFLDIIENFLEAELDIHLEQYSKASKQLHKKTTALRGTIQKFDSVFEEKVFMKLRTLEGTIVGGYLLNTVGHVSLPTSISKSNRRFRISNNKQYVPDFEGELNGVNWVIEVKGSYLHKGEIYELQRMIDISKGYGFQTWLIVMGELSDEARRFANENRIYMTDIHAWQEIERLNLEGEL